MERPIRDLVRRRAGDECECCGLSHDLLPFPAFQVDHIIPRQHGGTDDPSNLALACTQCNRRNGTNLSGVDPESGRIVFLYHPRNERWSDHFARIGPRIEGRTPEGRATVRLLEMNTEQRLDLRAGVD